MTRHGRGRVLACVLAALLAGCTTGTEVRDVVGLWSQATAGDRLLADLELEVVFDRSGDTGCWSARLEPGGDVLPVLWPPGTLAGTDGVLELADGGVVREGDVLAVGGGVIGTGAGGDAPPVASRDEERRPRGCDVEGGYVVVDEVLTVEGGDA